MKLWQSRMSPVQTSSFRANRLEKPSNSCRNTVLPISKIGKSIHHTYGRDPVITFLTKLKGIFPAYFQRCPVICCFWPS